MAEVQTFPKPRVPTANLPISMRDDAAKMLQPQEVDVPTYEDIMSGTTNTIGGFEIPQATIDMAASGDQKAQNFIRSRIDVAAMGPTTTQPIAGVTRTATGELKTDLPTTLNKDQTEVMEDYTENRKRFFSFLDQKIVDPRVRDLLIDHYSTGEFFRETGRQLGEQARFFGNVPNYLQVLGAYALPAAVEGTKELVGFGTTSYSEAWAKRQPAVASAFASYRAQLDQFGVSATYEDSLNDFIKKKFIEQYGEDAFGADYKLELEGMGSVEAPLIPTGMGQEILDFGFRELPTSEQGLSFLSQNAPVSGVFGLVHLAKGNRQLDRVKQASKADPSLARLDPVTAIRRIEADAAWTGFGKRWRNMTGRIGASFNNRGAIGAVEANESARSAIVNLNKRIKDKTDEYNRAKYVSLQDAKVIQGELDALNSRRNRILFSGAKNPYITNLMVDEGVIAIGQTAGYNLMPMLGFEQDTGGMIGALAFAFGGRQAIKFTVGGPINLLGKSKTLNTIGTNLVELIEDVSFIPKGLLVNRSLAELEAAVGRPLQAQEVASFKMLDKILKGMPNEQRELVFRSIENYNELRDRILSRFEPGEMRDEAADIFRLSFAHISGLAPLQALEFSSLKNASGEAIQDAVNFQMQSENSLEIAQRGISRLREMVQQSTGMDVEDSKFLAGWVENFQAAADQERMNIAQRKTEYLAMLRDYKNTLLSDPSTPIDENIVNNLAQAEIALVPGARESIEQQRNIIMETAATVQQRLNERANKISEMRGSQEYRRQLGILQEDIYDAHMSTIYALARNAYTKADEAIGDVDIDISSAVLSFISGQKQLDSKQLRGLFSAGSDFFSSRSGKMAHNAFNEMAKRSLMKNMGLDDDDVSELFQYVTTARMSDGSANPDFLGDVGEVSFIDVALHFGQKEGSQFSPFAAKPFEVEEVRRHFDKMGLAKKDDASAKPFFDAANDMEATLKANSDVWEAVKEARNTYRDLIFDPTRSGSTGNKIVGAASGPEFVTRQEGGYRKPYKLGMEPETWHRDLGLAIKDAVEGKEFATDKVANLMDDLTRFWGDRDESGQIVFDITTDKGRTKLENVANLVRANLYEYWAAAKESGLSEAVRQNVLGGDLPKGTYNFNAARNLTDRVAPAIIVTIKDADGTLQRKPLIDLKDMIAAEQDITQILAVSQDARTQYKNFTDEVNGKVGDMGTIAQEAVNLDKRIVNKFEELSQIRDPKKFYETYILNNDASLMQGLKANFVDTMVKGGMSEEEALKEFNQGMTYMVTNGMIARAGVAPNQEITFKALDGQKRTVETMTEAATIVADLDNPNVTAILEQFMEPDHIAFMQDIGEYMMYASGAAAVSFKPKGQIRGISPNELISRAFNIARGMVSPTYVAAEFAVRLMSQNNINALSLAASDKEAARIMQKVLETPGEVTQAELQTFTVLAKSFLTREIIRSGDLAPDFVPQEELYAAMINEQTKQETQYEAVP